MSIRLPSRYESLDPAFRGRLRADRDLMAAVKQAHAGMQISGGIRFMPIYGRSGSGKSSAARELATHLPESKVVELSRQAIISEQSLLQEVRDAFGRRNSPALLIAVVDQYEEAVAEKSSVPTQFVERLSLLDRGALAELPVLFLWLTTSREFQGELALATRRNERILVMPDYELPGPAQSEWATIVEETFAFHNRDQPLADFEVLREDIERIADVEPTLGSSIEAVGLLLTQHASQLEDLSTFQVVILWPVTDGHRITRVSAFTNARDGYKLDWGAFYRELNDDDRDSLPLAELNRARLYFDVRLVPIAAADLHALSRDLDDPDFEPAKSYLDQFSRSHFYSVVTERWDPSGYAPLKERESTRASNAKNWYDNTATMKPTQLGRRIAKSLTLLGVEALHEQTITTKFSKVRADVKVVRPGSQQSTCIVELKAFSTENTRPSSIKDAVRTTLKRHAQLAGFLARQ